ncbi:VWA domain-containing protein [Natroniella acetigena]|uniref:VWA domain-containing protein n=1 Tax=Natroniella acetigena TaxID=52004 RepID=UPI00200B0F1D|nr:VWA domain-containing protein [Natroniella acetigena]MCK8826789.1 VWA domain-containing protein [Natroniella acetigena]
MSAQQNVEQKVQEMTSQLSVNHIEHNLIKFIQILRNLGIRVSLAESIEALESLQLIDIINKDEFKVTLRSLLVKNHHEKEIFDHAFESFFIPQESKQQKQTQHQKKIEQQKATKQEIAEELRFKKDSVREDKETEEIELELTDKQKEIYSQLEPEIKEKIKNYIDSSFPGHLRHSSHTKPALERLIGGSLSYWQRRLKEDDEHKTEPSIQHEVTGDLEMDRVIEDVISNLKNDDNNLITKDLKSIPKEDLPQVTMLIKDLSYRLATKISRRFRQNKKIGKIDLRKTIRSNIKYGGILLDLKYKEKKIQKPKFLLICDTSDSMARYATFILQFIYGISSVVKDIESFSFSEDLERITNYFTEAGSFEVTIKEIISNSQQWGASTDLNTALETFKRDYMDLITPQTNLIIMSDTKTIKLYDAASTLKEIKSKAKDLIWLNTLPKSEWEDLKSVQVFKELSTMIECYTVKHLKEFAQMKFF